MAEGYDTNRFRSPIEDGFVCSICLGVLQDPKQCENNEHYFCSGCIKKHLETTYNCPACQDKLTVETLRKAPRIVSECISHYKISCDHAERGCDVVVEVGVLQAHVRECDFMPVSCSNEGCGEVVNKRDVKQHELDLCRFKTTTCDDCGKKMTLNKYGAHGCALRRDVDEMKKDLAEMRQVIKRFMIGFEKSTDIVVIAGRNSKVGSLAACERFNLFSQTWMQLPGLKIARHDAAAAMFRNQVFVCGGMNKFYKPFNSIEVLDLNGNPPEWREFCVNLPIEVAGHKCVVHGDRLLIIGGHIYATSCYGAGCTKYLDTIYEVLLVPPYSSKLLCHMKKKRAYHGVELFEDDKVLIAGGIDTQGIGYQAFFSVEIFDIARSECVEMRPLALRFPVSHMGTVRRGDTMLLIGGCDNTNKARNEIIEYNFKTGQSKVLLTMKTARSHCSCVFHGNTLIVIGDEQAESATAVDCFNFSSNSWKSLPSMAEARSSTCAVLVNMDN